MSSCTGRRASRLAGLLSVTLAALVVSGCPFSNYAGPSPASPSAPSGTGESLPPESPPGQDARTPPPTDPPPATSAPAVQEPEPLAAALPTAADGTLSATTGTIRAGVLAGSGTDPLTYAIIVPPLNGTAKLTDASTGAYTYVSSPDFSGVDKLQFTVTDSVGTSAPATVTIQVIGSGPGAH